MDIRLSIVAKMGKRKEKKKGKSSISHRFNLTKEIAINHGCSKRSYADLKVTASLINNWARDSIPSDSKDARALHIRDRRGPQ